MMDARRLRRAFFFGEFAREEPHGAVSSES